MNSQADESAQLPIHINGLTACKDFIKLFSFHVLHQLHCCAIYSLTQLLSLVGAEEHAELLGLLSLDGTSSVDVEVVPGLVEVGVKIGLEGSAGDAEVGAEDLGGEGSAPGLGEGEDTGWLAVDEFALGVFIALGALDGVVLDDRSDEDVVGVGSESSWDDSLILVLVLARLPGLVWGTSLVELDGGVLIRLGGVG